MLLLNPSVPLLTVCNTVSLLRHVTVLFTPIITIATAGEYPAAEVFEPAPRMMATFTIVIATVWVAFVVLVELVLVVLTLLEDAAEVFDSEEDRLDVVLPGVTDDVMLEV